ncbi:SEC14 cytosolic factor [Acrodontium crateriforme]|uniref:SEC14 cytosolic factor n=1 Tax=Acrodontium crateriforme TaxID=150365 RepID=A0AAQ3LXM5_9PEZI|nr:SEC14 cytosolic factor [Acrodontium crateriforme]
MADGGSLQRVESFQWPAGHVAHLTEHQQKALVEFKALCESKGYWRPGGGTVEEPPTHDDETMLRYLRARKFVPQDAFTQFKDTEDWREETQLDNLYETIDIEEYERTRRVYPQWTGRRDKRGIPFYVFEVSKIDTKEVTAKEKEDTKHSTNTTPRKMLRLFALYENLCRFVLPLCSAIPSRPHGETPISQSSNLVDISKVSLTKFWNLRAHMSDASTLATAHYPETLDRIFVVGAPSFFPTVWSWIQRWFDPITVSKIFILSEKEMRPTLEKFIDLDNVPKKYGGNLDWQFGDMPNLDDQIVNELQWNETVEQNGHRTFPTGPIKLQYGEKGELKIKAIGTEKGKPRNAVLAGLPLADGIARLALSPGRVNPVGHIDVSNNETVPSPPATTSRDSLNDSGKMDGAAVPPESRAGTFTVPYRDDDNDVAAPPFDARHGTSDTRFEQQANTHAEGQLAHGTPATKVDGQGTEHSVMDPSTVGQAPKEHPVPNGDEQQEQPTMIKKAQDVANQAYSQAGALSGSVMAAVGLGGNKAEVETPKKEPVHDPRVDNMDSKNVEEFLRHETMTEPQPPGQ